MFIFKVCQVQKLWKNTEITCSNGNAKRQSPKIHFFFLKALPVGSSPFRLGGVLQGSSRTLFLILPDAREGRFPPFVSRMCPRVPSLHRAWLYTESVLTALPGGGPLGPAEKGNLHLRETQGPSNSEPPVVFQTQGRCPHR